MNSSSRRKCCQHTTSSRSQEQRQSSQGDQKSCPGAVPVAVFVDTLRMNEAQAIWGTVTCNDPSDGKSSR